MTFLAVRKSSHVMLIKWNSSLKIYFMTLYLPLIRFLYWGTTLCFFILLNRNLVRLVLSSTSRYIWFTLNLLYSSLWFKITNTPFLIFLLSPSHATLVSMAITLFVLRAHSSNPPVAVLQCHLFQEWINERLTHVPWSYNWFNFVFYFSIRISVNLIRISIL